MSNEEKIIAILEEHSKRFDQIDKRFNEQEAKLNKKFEEQEARLNKKFDEQEARLNKKFDEQNDKFNEIFNIQHIKFNNIDQKLSSYDEDIKDIKLSISNINNTIVDINQKLASHDEDIKNMKSSIINIEIQVTEKIPALFDAITVNQDKHEIYDNAISSLNAKTFNHDIRISTLEDKIKSITV